MNPNTDVPLQNAIRPGGLLLTSHNAGNMLLSKKSRVLDIGCGTGISLKYINATFGSKVCGVDISEKACLAAKSMVPSACIKTADAVNLPFEDNFFDAVFMECVLSLLSRPEAALKEARRVLKPGGFLSVSTLSRLPKDIKSNNNGLLTDGAINPDALINFLTDLNFSPVYTEDRSDLLIQFVADIIFEYGSISSYMEKASSSVDGPVFSCDISPKSLKYHNYLFR